MSAVSERALIAAVTERLGRPPGGRLLRGPGDDAAVVRPGGVEVVSVDMVAEGVHFERTTHSARDVGHKALGSALSDVAAMGARPGEAYVGLALPPGTPEAWALVLVDGIEALARRSGVAVAGGDVVSASALVISVTVTGWAEAAEHLVSRSGARAGHLVGVTGRLGGAAAGLLLLEGASVGLDEGVREGLLTRHRRPEPRLAAGRALAEAGAAAMIDVSDGVATDAGHLSRESGVALVLELASLPRAAGVDVVAEVVGRDPSRLAATGGEDYELLFTGPAELRDAFEDAGARTGAPVTWLGRVERGRGVRLLDGGGRAVELTGYEHG